MISKIFIIGLVAFIAVNMGWVTSSQALWALLIAFIVWAVGCLIALSILFFCKEKGINIKSKYLKS